MRCDHRRSRIGCSVVSVSSSPINDSCRPSVMAGVDTGLDRRQKQLLEATRLGSGEGLVPHLAVGRAAPEILGLGARPDRFARSAAAQQPAAVGDHLLELRGVGGVGRRPRARTRGAGHDQVLGGTRLAQALAQPRDGGAQGDFRPVPVVVTPERVDESVDRHDEAAVDQQAGDQRTRLDPPRSMTRATPGDLERAEHADLQHGRRRLRDPCSPPHHSPTSRLSRSPCWPRC